MKLAIARRDLHPALSGVQRIVERRNTLPILSNVLLMADDRGVTLRATDLDIEVSTHVAAEVEEPGTITVPAARLHDIVGKLADGQIRLQAAGDTASTVEITSGRARFALQALPASDYPDLAVGDLPWAFALPADLVGAALEAVDFAISTEETRYYLNGVFLHATDDRLVFVATDGHRLSLVRRDLPDGAAGMPGVIVPRKTVAEITKLCRGNPKDARVSLSDAKIRFEIGDTVLLSKLIEGTFPDYGRVIPTGSSTVAVVPRESAQGALDRVMTIATERGRGVRLVLDPATAEMVFEVADPDSGRASEAFAATDLQGDPLTIGFNGRYLADAVEAIGGDAVRLAFGDAGSPVLLTPADDPDGERRLVVVMPMRV